MVDSDLDEAPSPESRAAAADAGSMWAGITAALASLQYQDDASSAVAAAPIAPDAEGATDGPAPLGSPRARPAPMRRAPPPPSVWRRRHGRGRLMVLRASPWTPSARWLPTLPAGRPE